MSSNPPYVFFLYFFVYIFLFYFVVLVDFVGRENKAQHTDAEVNVDEFIDLNVYGVLCIYGTFS